MKKNLLLLATTFALLTGAFALSSCGGSTEKKGEPNNETNPVSKDSTKATAYVCPMGPACGKGETAGKCGGCGMDLVANDKGLK